MATTRLGSHNDLSSILTRSDRATFTGPIIPSVPKTLDVSLPVKIRRSVGIRDPVSAAGKSIC